jgi:hypothetical protein
VSAVDRPPAAPGTLLCPRCGSALREDQGWCLECGLAARTRVHPPPSWRWPVAVTGVLLALLAAGIAVALVTLLDTPESTPAPATVTAPAAAAPPAASTPATNVPTTSTPAATVPTVPTTTSPPPTTPGSTTPTTPSGGASQRTFTIPGTRIRLPATSTR